MVGSPQPPTYHNLVLAFIQILNLTQSVPPRQLSPHLTQSVSRYSHRCQEVGLSSGTRHVTIHTRSVTGDRAYREYGKPERKARQEAGSGVPFQ